MGHMATVTGIEQRLAIEHGATQVLAESNSVAEAAPALIATVCKTLGWDGGAWWNFDLASDTMHCVGTWGVGTPQVDEFLEHTRTILQSRQPGGLIRRTWLAGEAIWMRDVTADKSFRRGPLALKCGLRSAFAIPIKTGTLVTGVIEFFSREIHQPDPDLLDCMSYVGSQIGQFLKRAAAEEALRVSEARFRGLTALSSDWYWEQDNQFRLTFMSTHMGEKTGLDASAYLGRKRWDQPALNLTEVDWDRHRAQLERHEPFRDFEMQRPAADGRTAWLSLSGEPVFDALGTFTGYRGVGRDVTAQKSTETALRGSEARFRSLTALSSDWYWELDAELRFTKFEGNGRLGASYSPAPALIGKLSWEVPGGVPRSGDWNEYRAKTSRREPLRDFEYSYCDRLGKKYYIAVDGEPVFDESGGFAGYRGTSRDVTERRRREDELAQFRAVMDASPDMTYVTDRETMRFLYANEAACRLTGFSREEFLKMGPADLLRVDRKETEREYDEVIAAGEAGTVREVKSTTRDGLRTMVEVRRRAMRLDDRWVVFTTAHDISLRKRAEQAMVRSGRMFAALSATNEAIMRATSQEDLYQRVCEAAVNGGKLLATAVIVAQAGSATVAAFSGSAPQRLWKTPLPLEASAPEGQGMVGTAFRTGTSSVSDDLLRDERIRSWHDDARAAGMASGAAIPLLRAGKAIGVLLLFSGEKHAFDGEIVKLLERMAENVVFGLDNFAKDLQRREAEERAQYLATHDGLTGLPNRVLFSQLLNHAIDTSQRYKRRFAVLFIDLDRFKIINDTLGHQAGDQLLQTISGRLKKTVRTSDVVARLGGDEFVVLLQEIENPAQVQAVARKILSAVIRPMEIAGQECRVTTSIGISMYPVDATDERALMKNADMAMYLAKEEGKNNFQIYSKEIKAQSVEKMALETNLRRALEKSEFSLHYQAKQDLRSGAITGVEALLRWTSPQLGPLTPAQFIPLAEETGLIVPIGKWVLRTACAQHVAWLRQGLPAVPVAVNLSPRQFADPQLLGDIAAALREVGMPAGMLELEITESMVMQNPDQAVQLLRAIKKMGVRLSIDDFGTGYSSLAQLKRFPIDTLKIDRSFIRDIPQDTEDKAITQAIIALGKTLSLTVIAEGVETEEQQAFLRGHSCDQIQGYLFSKPVPPEQFAELLRSHVLAV